MSPRSTSVILLSREPGCRARERLAALLDVASGIAAEASVISARLTDPPLRRLETAARDTDSGSEFDGIEVYTAIDLPGIGPGDTGFVETILAADPGYGYGWEFHQHQLLPVPDGIEDGWVARVGLARGLPELAQDAFFRYWADVHAPLVIDHGPGFRGYRLHDPVQPSLLAPWGGFFEQFYPSLEAWVDHDNAIFETKPAVRADLSKFLGAVQQYCAHDFVVLKEGDQALV